MYFRGRLPVVLILLQLCCGTTVALADFNYSVPPYDLADLGTPQFVNTNYIDVQKVQQLSKFRSNAGHDYSDATEFGSQALIDPNTGKPESCRSMKHYFFGVDITTAIYAPVAGTITGLSPNDPQSPDVQIGIQSDVQPAFGFNLFHVIQSTPLTVGQHVAEGQLLGYAPDPIFYPANDIAVFVMTTTGFHLVSYFDVLTDAAFAPFMARGVASRSALSYTAAQRDAAPFQCVGEDPPMFVFSTTNYVDPSLDYVTLTGGDATQTISVGPIPTFIKLGGPPLVITATPSSGLPVTITSSTPSVCTVSGNAVTPVAAGLCSIQATQLGNTNLHEFEYPIQTTVIAGLNAGPVYSSAQTDFLSYLRFYNTGTGPGTVTVTLFDSGSGQSFGPWTSPAIPAGSEQQYSIASLESALNIGATKPPYYSVLVQAGITGFFQHVLLRPAEGVLTNLTTCTFGIGADPTSLSGVHSSLIGALGYPSSIAVNNMGSATSVALDIYDAQSGAKLGTYMAATTPGNGLSLIDVGTMEAAANIIPTAGMYHYVIKAESPFTGYLQHLVNNTKLGIVTDMTRQCTLDGSTPPGILTGTTSTQLGPVYSSANPSSQSYLKIRNNSVGPGTITITLNDPTSGQALGQWTSPSIPGDFHTVETYSVADLETALAPNTTKPPYYFLTMQTNFGGQIQHLVLNTAAGAMTNLSTCSLGASPTPAQMYGIDASLIGGYPSTVIFNNTASAAASVAVAVYDEASGNFLGGITKPIAGNGILFTTTSALEATFATKPTAGMYQYFVGATSEPNGGPPPGYFQNLVTSQQSGVIDDLSTPCQM